MNSPVIKCGNGNHQFIVDFLIKSSIYSGFAVAMFDYRRVKPISCSIWAILQLMGLCRNVLQHDKIHLSTLSNPVVLQFQKTNSSSDDWPSLSTKKDHAWLKFEDTRSYLKQAHIIPIIKQMQIDIEPHSDLSSPPLQWTQWLPSSNPQSRHWRSSSSDARFWTKRSCF